MRRFSRLSACLGLALSPFLVGFLIGAVAPAAPRIILDPPVADCPTPLPPTGVLSSARVVAPVVPGAAPVVPAAAPAGPSAVSGGTAPTIVVPSAAPSGWAVHWCPAWFWPDAIGH